MLATHQDRRIGTDAVRPRVGNGGVARGKERGEGRLGATTRERSAGSWSKACQITHPPDDAMLNHCSDRRHLEYRDGLIERGRDAFGPDRGRQRSRHLVTRVARVVEVIRIRNDLRSETRDDVVDRKAGAWGGFVEALGERRRGVLGRSTARWIARLGEVVRGDIGECARNVGAGVRLDCRQNSWLSDL
jgi:hypothetical protein